ncbi:PEP-CTERM sorting domain-containing protein [Anabaena cylindrica UHCC 0172]|uniref:PEP-CTERM sorting domain-containing protein n=1 Tax=Anabaena cylindrica TaxID=1165 RepID=UPI002B21BF06|nr:PEP-CTERM sorting domain-containing protein [Anabaena cylindrica]MEA5551387.1 PEP-CTERM sorting domain-containing protein [Anabaena cylindrica UHCC 0172]
MTILSFVKIKPVSALGIASALSLSLVTVQSSANATGIVRITEDAFTADAGLITFSELPLNTFNPTYAPSLYGGGVGSPTVTFGGIFLGQTVGVAPFPIGALPSGVVNGTPTNSLTLDSNSPQTRIVGDGSNPTSPVLSGSPIFSGPISILFDTDIAGVGLDGGFFNAIGGTAIKAFGRTGALLGLVTNTGLGIEFLGLVTDDGQDKIAGLQFSLVGSEPFGFAIDNLRFGRTGQVVVPTPITVPEPASIIGILGLGAFGVTSLRKRKQATAVKA